MSEKLSSTVQPIRLLNIDRICSASSKLSRLRTAVIAICALHASHHSRRFCGPSENDLYTFVLHNIKFRFVDSPEMAVISLTTSSPVHRLDASQRLISPLLVSNLVN